MIMAGSGMARPFSVIVIVAGYLVGCTIAAIVDRQSFGSTSNGVRDTRNKGCGSDKLIVYRVTLNTFWSPEMFPKHYPKWRPPAQWSKVIGRSHDSNFELFRVGRLASKGLQLFAERGASEVIDIQSQGSGGVYDEFNAPPIPQGVGKSVAEFFVDGSHPKVSIVSRMVPSPDWFIGVDSFDLCPKGEWLDNVTVRVDPLDAGTDKGLTFSSPNWAEDPNVPITVMTSSSPDHPAASFFYPDKDTLPAIAEFNFLRVKEYELSQVYHQDDVVDKDLAKVLSSTASRDTGYGSKKNPGYSNGYFRYNVFPEPSSTTQGKIEDPEPGIQLLDGTSSGIKDAQNAIPQTLVTRRGGKNPTSMYDFESSDAEAPSKLKNQGGHKKEQESKKRPNPPVPSDFESERRSAFESKLEGDLEEPRVLASKQVMPKVDAVSSQISRTENGLGVQEEVKTNAVQPEVEKAKVKNKKRKLRHRNQHRKPRDCKVTDWSEWTECNKQCGIGERTRTREVLKHPRRGGKPCPQLEEKEVCRNYQGCQIQRRRYFNWARR